MLNETKTLTEEEQWELEDYYYQLEKEWRASLPSWTEWQWATFFADNPTVIRAGMKYRLEKIKQEFKQLYARKTEAIQTILSNDERPILEYILEQIAEQEKKLLTEQRMARGILKRFCTPKKKAPTTLPPANPQEGITVTPPPVAKERITELDRDNAKMIPIEQIYGGPWKHTGNTLLTRCPFHSEKTPSFTVYRNKNRFHCFGCGVDGDVIEFVMKQQSTTFIEAVKYLLGK